MVKVVKPLCSSCIIHPWYQEVCICVNTSIYMVEGVTCQIARAEMLKCIISGRQMALKAPSLLNDKCLSFM